MAGFIEWAHDILRETITPASSIVQPSFKCYWATSILWPTGYERCPYGLLLSLRWGIWDMHSGCEAHWRYIYGVRPNFYLGPFLTYHTETIVDKKGPKIGLSIVLSVRKNGAGMWRAWSDNKMFHVEVENYVSRLLEIMIVFQWVNM